MTALVGALLISCGGRDPAGRDGGARDGGGGGADAATGACAPDNRAACAYQPERTYPVPQGAPMTYRMTYMDVAGGMRSIEVALRPPMGAPRPWPVIVWSHGGSEGIESARGAGAEWAQVFNRAGYVVVAIAHTPRNTPALLEPLCRYYGYSTQDACVRFKHLHHDRPFDVRRVLDWITAEQASGPNAESFDLQRILYAGHSAGAGAASVVAGATRDLNGRVLNAPDPRPRAFIGFSIEGPMDDGFTDGSFAPIARPHLSVTGIGDVTSESMPAQRRRAFELMMPGNKFRFWMTDPAARHGSFDHNVGPCEDHQMRNGGSAALCEDFYRWMESAGLAFADAYLRERPEAIAWLASNNAVTLSGSLVEWSRR
jgi:predicted dienelactone hydrolase